MSDTKDTPDVLKALREAVKGLHWPSESNKPIRAFLWKQEEIPVADGDGISEVILRAAGKIDAAATVTPVALDEFFAPVTSEQDWFGDEEQATAKRFQELAAALKQHITNLCVFRIAGGHSDASVVDVLVLGRAAEGSIAGVSTQLIET